MAFASVYNFSPSYRASLEAIAFLDKAQNDDAARSRSFPSPGFDRFARFSACKPRLAEETPKEWQGFGDQAQDISRDAQTTIDLLRHALSSRFAKQAVAESPSAASAKPDDLSDEFIFAWLAKPTTLT